jgi:hypothetical protein
MSNELMWGVLGIVFGLGLAGWLLVVLGLLLVLCRRHAPDYFTGLGY